MDMRRFLYALAPVLPPRPICSFFFTVDPFHSGRQADSSFPLGDKQSFPGGSEMKESACNVGDLGSITGSGKCPGEGNGYPLQGSCLENSMDRGAWQATVHGAAKSQTQLSD